MKDAQQIALKKPFFIKASDGLKLACYEFLLNKQPEKVIIFYHGGGAYQSHHYQYMAHQLQEEHEIMVYLVDIRGHGYSQGLRGHASSAKQVWNDVDTIVNFVQKKHSGAKIYLGGHSAGCGLLINYVYHNKRNDIAGYVFVAPYLGPFADTRRSRKDPEKFDKKFAVQPSFVTRLSRFFTSRPIESNTFVTSIRLFPFLINNITAGMLCGNTYAVTFSYPKKTLKERPLLVNKYTVNMANAVTPRLPKKQVSKINKPVYVFIGDQDQLFDPQKVFSYFLSADTNIVSGQKHMSVLLNVADLIAQKI